MEKDLVLYQPCIYYDDGINIGWNLPNEMCSFQVFVHEDELHEFMERNGYHKDEYIVNEYGEDDIEDYEIIDQNGESLYDESRPC